jgi:DNA-binding protein WhiA
MENSSFSWQVKSEICKTFSTQRCCALAECYGILLFCNTFSAEQIRIITEHPDFAQRIPKLFKRAFGLEFDEYPLEEPENGKYVFRLLDREKIRTVFTAFGLSAKENVTLHLNRGVLEDDCCYYAFIRGALLAGGSVIDPEKRYHLELSTTHRKICSETYSVLLDMGFLPKEITHNGAYVLYFKQSNQIEDFLTAVDAPICAMKIMEAKIEKQMRNQVNRLCNCDDANTDKVVEAAQKQIAAIESLQESGRFETMPVKLQEVAMLRLQEPEATLLELAGRLSLTKSAINHRMRKIMELSKQ